MVVVADASVAIRGDLSKFHQDLRGAETQTKSLGGKLKDALSPRNIIGAAGALGLVLGVKQLLGVAGDAAEAYQELQQTARTVDTVFGDSAGVIHDWGEAAADAAGLSKREVSESAAVMGSMLTNMGFDAADAADMVVRAQQRAADLAIGLGKDTGEAILGISALLRGEFDTIEKLGVRIKQADVNARVVALGLDTSTASAKKNAEAIAALDLFFEQTEKSAGRFANSQDDVSVKLEKAQANAENARDAFGQMVTEIQNGAFIVAEATGSYLDTASDNIGRFAMNFGSQRVQVLAVADQMGEDFGVLADRVAARMDETGESFEEALAFMTTEAAIAAHGITESMTEGMRATHQVVQRTSEDIRADWEAMSHSLPQAIRNRWADTRSAAFQMAVEHAKGILNGQNQIKVALEVLTQLQEEEQTKAQRISYLNGLLNSQSLRDGLNDGRPGVRGAANALRGQIIAELAGLGVNAYGWGSNVSTSIAAGMYAYAYQAGQAAGYVASKIQGPLQIRSEPPDPDSPLRGITRWGGNIVKTIAEGIYGELGTGSAAASALAGALVPSLRSIEVGHAAGQVGMGQTITNYNLIVEGKPKVVGIRDEVIDAWLQEEQF